MKAQIEKATISPGRLESCAGKDNNIESVVLTRTTDGLNRTELRINGELPEYKQLPQRLSPNVFDDDRKWTVNIARGAEVELCPPGGKLTGEVSSITIWNGQAEVHLENAVWEGSYGSFVGRASGFGGWIFQPEDITEVETSAWREPVSWLEYQTARSLVAIRHPTHGELDPHWNRVALQGAIACIQEFCRKDING